MLVTVRKGYAFQHGPRSYMPGESLDLPEEVIKHQAWKVQPVVEKEKLDPKEEEETQGGEGIIEETMAGDNETIPGKKDRQVKKAPRIRG